MTAAYAAFLDRVRAQVAAILACPELHRPSLVDLARRVRAQHRGF